MSQTFCSTLTALTEIVSYQLFVTLLSDMGSRDQGKQTLHCSIGMNSLVVVQGSHLPKEHSLNTPITAPPPIKYTQKHSQTHLNPLMHSTI